MSDKRTESSTVQILIVDDHPVLRDGLSLLLREHLEAERVSCVGTAKEAVSIASEFPFTLAIIDLTLPDGSGLELIRDLTAISPTLPVLVVSMHDEVHYAERALRAGAKGYVMKECGSSTVIEAAKVVLGGGIYASPGLTSLILSRVRERNRGNGELDALSDREFEIFELVGAGATTKEIARRLSLSGKTVDTHKASIRRKLKIRDGHALYQFALRWTEGNSSPSAGEK